MIKNIVRLFVLLIPLSIPVFSSDWYVRPEGGSYGAENGTSYANAWDGLKKVVWGNNGVKAGDTLYICGLHLKEYKAGLTTVDRTITPVGGSGDSSRVTIRGDYPGDPGIIWGGSLLKHEPWVNEGSNTYSITLPMDMWTDWFFEDVTASGRTVLTKVGSLAECQSRPGSHYSSNYQQGSKLYIHCSNNGDPTNRIVANGGGWFWACDTASYLTFKNLKFYCRNIVSAFSHMRYDGCTIWYADVNVLTFTEQYSYVEIISCDIAHGQTGIGFAMQLAGTGPHHVLVRGNKIHDMGTRPSLYNPDSHAIGVNSLSDSIIELNEMYNCGSTLAFYAYDSGINSSIKNNTVRWNYIHDAHRLGGSSGNGIEFTCGASHGDCSGNACIGNIVVCTGEDAFRSKWKQTVKFYNNVAYGASRFNYYFGNAYNEVRVEAKNNISMNPGTYHIEFQTNAAAGNYVCDVDYNLYYPDSGTKFIFQDASDVQYVNFSGWKSLAKPGCTFDPHSPTPADPKFVNASGTLRLDTDFKLQSSSPAIDRGVNVGLTQDRAGVAVPQSSAPDIGAYEYVFGSNPLLASLNASPTSGYAPLTVTFSGSATGGAPPYTFRWNFGDGSSSTAQNPSNTYSSPGNYTATLTVTDSQSATNSKSLTINVTSIANPLIASSSASPSSGQAPLTVNFNGSATGGTPPYTYRWNFGDGQSSTSQNPSHTYSAAGNYVAILTVTDSQSATATNSVSINVTATPGQLLATASGSPTSGLAPLAVNFTGSATGGTPPYSYSWNFGDGTSSTAQNPSHTYSTIGNYIASLTVTDSGSANASATVSIAVGSVTAASLDLAAVTGAPAPGQGGTTDPSPGNHSFSVGSTASVRSIPNTDYRFSKWTGDITEAATFNLATTLTMDKNKSVSATFCTMCADVTGDLRITPADAQRAFDIYLGRIANPTWCELENADINCSGTKFAPKVTPADAQTIFHKYLRKGVVSSDCSGNSRGAALATQSSGFLNVSLTISNVTFALGQDVVIPIVVESPSDIKAFGFDLSYPSDILTYIGLESTELTNDFDQLDANVLAYQGINQERPKTGPAEDFVFGFDPIFSTKILTLQAINNSRPSPEFDPPSTGAGNYRLLRVGGYKTESTENPTSGVLVTLIFRVIGEVKDPGSISVIATYDDIKNASIKNDGMINRQNSPQVREDERPVRKVERKTPGKRYDF